MVRVNGNYAVGKEAQIFIDIIGENLPDKKDLFEAYVTDSKGFVHRASISWPENNTFTCVAFTPWSISSYKVEIKKGGVTFWEKDVDVRMASLSVAQAGKPHELGFEIPGVKLPDDLKYLKASLQSSAGKIIPADDIQAGPNNRTVVAKWESMADGDYKCTFKKGESIVGDVYEITVNNSGEAGTVLKEIELDLEIPNLDIPDDLKYLTAKLALPDGRERDLKASCGADNSLGLAFTPESTGIHKIEVFKNGIPVGTYPVDITDNMGTKNSCKEAEVGQICDVNLSIPDIVLKDFKMMKGKLITPMGYTEALEITLNDDGSHSVSFLPASTGDYMIEITLKGKPVLDTLVYVTDGKQTDSAKPQVGRQCSMVLDIPGINLPRDLKNMDATLTSPMGKMQPVSLKVSPDNNAAVRFTPEDIGEYKIEITKRSEPVKGSPFSVLVES